MVKPMKMRTYHLRSIAVLYLIDKDPKLKSLIEKKPEIIVPIDDDYFVSLAQTIIAQQLSSKVAQVITTRLMTHLNHDLSPRAIRDADPEVLRSLGLSYPKITYLRSLADCIMNHQVDFASLDDKTDQEIIEMLTQIKGIGIWSAQMFLIFSLGREDVFSVHDLGLRNAVKKVYNAPDLTSKEIEHIASQWSPYRSVASHYLWHSWDNES